MKTIVLTDSTSDWRAIVQEVQSTGLPVALTIDSTVCGILLPTDEATHVVMHYDAREQRRAWDAATRSFEEPPNYLDLLLADPSLVPVVDGQPLEF